LEHQYGKHQMRKFLKDALDKYLQGRTFEGKKEKPLMYNENQQYIHYNKGSLVLYTLSDYIGEKTMNSALKSYINKVAFQDAPYTNSLELVQELKTATPDSLKYLIADMFENITLYDNKIKTATTKKLANGKYQVDITFNVSKYKADEQGKRIFKNQQGKTLVINKTDKKTKIESLPLQDYIELGIFANENKKDPTKEKTLFLKKIKVNKIQNTFTIVVDKKPTEVGVDPYNKLIDTDSNDNRKSL
jgi:ABC-2 type transport system permease protein